MVSTDEPLNANFPCLYFAAVKLAGQGEVGPKVFVRVTIYSAASEPLNI